MKIAILGYGKMGKAIEAIALDKGHEVVLKTTSETEFSVDQLKEADVAIEFSRPEAAYENVMKCLESKVPVVIGTTGWYEQFGDVEDACRSLGGSLFHATNFSIGVNIFFRVNRTLAKLMNDYPDYDVAMEEIHHTEKLDSPSGTAITLAQGIISEVDRKEKWSENDSAQAEEVGIVAKREPDVPGTHHINWSSKIDSIEIKHTAHDRTGFASGSLLAAEWLIGKSGIYSMDDLLNDYNQA